MTQTVLTCANREVIIGFERPFVVIGERINPTGRKKLARKMAEGDYSQVETDALAQIEAGAHMLDINAGVSMADGAAIMADGAAIMADGAGIMAGEAAIMADLVALVQSLAKVPLCLDSSDVAALEAGLQVYDGKALVNSVTGEEKRLEAVLPLIRKHGAAVVAICNDESGISPDPDTRFAVAKKIIERAADHAIPAADVVVDPLVMPVGALNDAGRTALQVVRRVREELKVNTICGASNISFGLPKRAELNTAFLSLLIGAGLTSAIVNPLHSGVMAGIAGAEVMMGLDRRCMRWIRRARAEAGAPGA